MRADPSRGTSLGLVVGAVLVTLTGCWSSGADQGAPPREVTTPPPVPVDVVDYVALGDSYTSAPLVPTTDLAEGCFRSDANYPSLLAEQLDPERFVDVSCSAATTSDLIEPQATAGGRGRVPPQLRALTPETDLVTVGIGANDEGLFARLISCVRAGSPQRCAQALGSSREVLQRTRTRVADAVGAVRTRAPEATVVLVGYPRLVAPDSPCPRVPAPDDRLDELAAVERALDRSLQAAARSAGASYVDMHAASKGHEACSPDPWVNGRRTDQDAALAYHPFAAGQQAVASRVVELLVRRSGTGS